MRTKSEQSAPEENMLLWAVVFFVLAFIAAIFGFGLVAGAAAGLAEILFYGFLALGLITLVANFSNRRSSP
jgi:uncharacterized membrane protein YtjA (UPF0391 family)